MRCRWGGGWSFVEGRDLDGGFEAGAGEFVEADGDGLAEVHGEVAGVVGGVHRDGGEEGGMGELVVGEAVFSEPKRRATRSCADGESWVGCGGFGRRPMSQKQDMGHPVGRECGAQRG